MVTEYKQLEDTHDYVCEIVKYLKTNLTFFVSVFYLFEDAKSSLRSHFI